MQTKVRWYCDFDSVNKIRIDSGMQFGSLFIAMQGENAHEND